MKAMSIGLALALCAGCGFSKIGSLDEGKVLAESQLHPETIRDLKKRNLLGDGEKILCYYHRAVGDVTYVLTDDKLVEFSGAQVSTIRYADLAAVVHTPTPLGRITTVRALDHKQIVYAIYDINGGGIFKSTLDREWARVQVGRATNK